MDEYYVYLTIVVGAARNKSHGSFSTCGGKKVAHHWRRITISLISTLNITSLQVYSHVYCSLKPVYFKLMMLIVSVHSGPFHAE